MLTTLRISGFAIVEQAEVRFGPGLNVLTGETGAGKSIVLEALHLALGGRMSADVIREGADEAVVEALFELPADHPLIARITAAGLPVSTAAPEILVRRTASRSGRGRVFVNGALCTVAMLEGCLRGLVDITGQHEHVSLLDESTHLPLLDGFAGIALDAEGPLARYRSSWAALRDALHERAALLEMRADHVRLSEEIAADLGEIEKANPRPGEDGELDRERALLVMAERLRQGARAAEALAYGDDGSAAERLGRAVRTLADCAGIDARLEPALASLRAALAEVEEAGRVLGRYADAVDGDPERLRDVEERLAILKRLARKHGGTLELVLARAGELRSRLAALEDPGERLARLEADIASESARTIQLARELTEARRRAARELPRDIACDLKAVAMGHCRFEVEILPAEGAVTIGDVALGPGGAEGARLLFAPNPGEPARPLARIASGGELSRIVLAMKRALARVDPVETYVFDEVDSGIGGGVAEAVGRLLSHVSRQRQVISVTHLPQVAAFADRHLRVDKRVRGGRTLTSVVTLDSAEERRSEVARMLAGTTLTDSALEHARALIAGARSPREEPAPRLHDRRSGPVRTAARMARVNALTGRVRG